jgi:hypothetical protein
MMIANPSRKRPYIILPGAVNSKVTEDPAHFSCQVRKEHARRLSDGEIKRDKLIGQQSRRLLLIEGNFVEAHPSYKFLIASRER